MEELAIKDFGSVLQIEKGWKLNALGNEYMLTWRLKSYLSIEIQVATTVPINPGKPKNRGSDCIRVWAVLDTEYSDKRKRYQGLVKAHRVHLNDDFFIKDKRTWQEQLKITVIKVIDKAKDIYEEFYTE